MFAMYDNYAVDNLIVDDDSNEERLCKNNSELQASMILFNIAILIVTNVKIYLLNQIIKMHTALIKVLKMLIFLWILMLLWIYFS